ncbi:hypothetical protein IE81DRAFT_249077 [Ceraceosorus guamensis]|uniref:Uncharacterized protein n=1 Tax=Ceraceosorus guamensis TaxID=1522189 RepID=A0A316VUH3_9BASI|nr:hypothetical protein IE81DRAFT_249077 [Ceraceosorus guamensis]PWN39911.1 hypothetical protein IE81DRAFT_249077 [Ceraceosorus guamensis]
MDHKGPDFFFRKAAEADSDDDEDEEEEDLKPMNARRRDDADDDGGDRGGGGGGGGLAGGGAGPSNGHDAGTLNGTPSAAGSGQKRKSSGASRGSGKKGKQAADAGGASGAAEASGSLMPAPLAGGKERVRAAIMSRKGSKDGLGKAEESTSSSSPANSSPVAPSSSTSTGARHMMPNRTASQPFAFNLDASGQFSQSESVSRPSTGNPSSHSAGVNGPSYGELAAGRPATANAAFGSGYPHAAAAAAYGVNMARPMPPLNPLLQAHPQAAHYERQRMEQMRGHRHSHSAAQDSAKMQNASPYLASGPSPSASSSSSSTDALTGQLGPYPTLGPVAYHNAPAQTRMHGQQAPPPYPHAERSVSDNVFSASATNDGAFKPPMRKSQTALFPAQHQHQQHAAASSGPILDDSGINALLAQALSTSEKVGSVHGHTGAGVHAASGGLQHLDGLHAAHTAGTDEYALLSALQGQAQAAGPAGAAHGHGHGHGHVSAQVTLPHDPMHPSLAAPFHYRHHHHHSHSSLHHPNQNQQQQQQQHVGLPYFNTG